MDINEQRGFNECWPGESLKEGGTAWGIRLGCGHSHSQDTWYRVRDELWAVTETSACALPAVYVQCLGTTDVTFPLQPCPGAAVVAWAEPEPLRFPIFILQSLFFSSSSVLLLHPSPLLSTHLPCGGVLSAVLFPHGLLSYLSKSIVSIFSFIPCPFFCNGTDFDGSSELCLPVLRASLSVTSYSWHIS